MRTAIRNFTMVLVGSLMGAALMIGYVELRPEPVAGMYYAQAASQPVIVESRAAIFDEAVAVEIYERLNPAVVNVTNRRMVSDSFSGSQFPERGIGTGVIVDEHGHILTNNHVIEGAETLDITLVDGTQVPATLVGSDPGNDLAVLRIDMTESVRRIVAIAPLGDSDRLKPGQIAIAIGNPFGFRSTMTTGIISSIGRTFPGDNGRSIRNVIQTDAAINPGNSGGPLINSAGEVIGINTAIESPVRGFVGIGFAVPINTAKLHLPTMLAGHTIEHAWMGVSGITITPEVALMAGLSVTRGVYLAHVLPGGPADLAGLRAAISTIADIEDGLDELPGGGDVVVAIDGRPVSDVEEMVSYVDQKRAGDRIALSIVRDGTPLDVTVVLGSWPSN
jgi:S1-C subfamily serine protease